MIRFLWLIVFCSSICSATPPKKDKRKKVALYSTMSISKKLVTEIQRRAYDLYNLKVNYKGRYINPSGYEDSTYNADKIAMSLVNKRDKRHTYVVGLTNVPLIRLYLNLDDIDQGPGFEVSPVIGFTNLTGNTCVVSQWEMIDGNSIANRDSVIKSRSALIIMHEIGHLMGLDDCEDTTCLMVGQGHFDNNRLCGRCAKDLKDIQNEKPNKKPFYNFFKSKIYGKIQSLELVQKHL